jgi:two-component system sensor histidine kinase QseC
MRRPISLQTRLLAGVLGALLLVWAAAALMTWREARHELDELLDAHLAQAAALLVVQQIREAPEGDDDHAVDAPVLDRYAPRVAFQVFHEGRLALRSSNAPGEPLAEGREGFSDRRVAGAPWRVFTAIGAERDVTVHVAERRDSRAEILRGLLQGLLQPLGLALPLLALLAGASVRGALRPLRRLAEHLGRRGADDLRPVTLPGAAAEIATVMQSLDALFARIAGLLEGERRFTADAAHELRTPIAIIRAQAQVAWAATDDEERHRALRATLEGCDRAGRLVGQLLTLTQLEARGGLSSDAPSVDLHALARRELADAAPRALAREQALELEAQPGVAMRGDETLLEVLLRNLVDNALRYAPRGAAVRVSVESKDGRARLVVEDGGPGLPDAELARLGERFFRPGGQGASGSGLGWSIVRRIAAVHGLAVVADRSPTLGGLRVAVSGPLAR